MTRKASDTVDYFPHDCHAAHGRTISILKHKYGKDGVMCWWLILELLGRTPGHYFNYSNPADVEYLLAETWLDKEDILVDILSTLAILGAIDKELNDQKIIWSQNFVDGVSDVYKNSRHRPPPDKPINEAREKITTQDNPHSGSISTEDNPQSKGSKGSKVKEVEGIKQSFGEFQNVKLSQDEHAKLVERLSEPVTTALIERLSCYMSSKGKSYRSHYATLLNWSRNSPQQASDSPQKGGRSVRTRCPERYPEPNEI